MKCWAHKGVLAGIEKSLLREKSCASSSGGSRTPGRWFVGLVLMTNFCFCLAQNSVAVACLVSKA